MITLAEVREALKDRNLAAVARNTGIHPATMHRLMNGSMVSYAVYEKLNNYLESSLPGRKEES